MKISIQAAMNGIGKTVITMPATMWLFLFSRASIVRKDSFEYLRFNHEIPLHEDVRSYLLTITGWITERRCEVRMDTKQQ